MKRKRAVPVLIGATLCLSAAILAGPGLVFSSRPTETPVRVHTAQVCRGSIVQTVALTGRLGREQEYAAPAPSSGIVADIYVRQGQTVAAGTPLFRMDSTLQEQAVSQALAASLPERWSAELQQVPAAEEVRTLAGQRMEEQVRAAEAALTLCTVRAAGEACVEKVCVSECGPVAAGTPVVMLSGGAQQAVCSAVVRDAAQLAAGMQAVLSAGGEILCGGRVSAVGPAEADAVTGQTVCRVTVQPDAPLSLPLGAKLDVEITCRRQDDVTILPVTALTPEETVWWSSDGRAYQIPAPVLLEDGTSCWVALPEGVEVVDSPSGLIEGQRVKEVKP